jgi:hypothetical protein
MDLYEQIAVPDPTSSGAGDEKGEFLPPFPQLWQIATLSRHEEPAVLKHHRLGPTFEMASLMKIEIEVAARPKGTRNALHDLEQIRLSMKMIDRTPLRCHAIDRFRQAELAHVRVYYVEFHAFLPRFFASNVAHAFGKVDRVDPQALPGKFNRVCARTATKLANGSGLS